MVRFRPFSGRATSASLTGRTASPQRIPGSKTKIAAGVVGGFASVAAARGIMGACLGVGAAGPVAGGVFAGLQSAGYTLATLQSFAMGSATASSILAGGVTGGLLGSMWDRSQKPRRAPTILSKL